MSIWQLNGENFLVISISHFVGVASWVANFIVTMLIFPMVVTLIVIKKGMEVFAEALQELMWLVVLFGLTLAVVMSGVLWVMVELL